MNWTTSRRETALVEHVCEHGVGHPNRGSAVWLAEHYAKKGETGGRESEESWLIHGCDGCCQQDDFPGTVERALRHSHKLIRGWKDRFETELKVASGMRACNGILTAQLKELGPPEPLSEKLPRLTVEVRELFPRDRFFLDTALNYARLQSNHPYTKTGCVITGHGERILSLGVNRLPKGVYPLQVERPWFFQRPELYLTLMHAEVDAILRANLNGVSLERSTMWLPWFPCAPCAQVIIMSGIVRLVCTPPNYESKRTGMDWRNSMLAAEALFASADFNVEFVEYEGLE